jgi:transposase
MKKFREEPSREQRYLLPLSLDEYVPLEDGVRYVDSFVEELDLTSIEDSYKSGGRPAYSPRTMVKILVYGTLRGIRSSRELSRTCKENLRFIFLAKNEKPDFRTISYFRKRFIKELSELLKQTVRIGLEEGFITLEQVAIDGTKIRADAGRRSFKNVANLEQVLLELENALKEGAELDQDEDEKHKDDDGDFKLPKELTNKKALADKIKTALKEKNNLSQLKDISLTDPEARYMKGQEGMLPSYNAQAAVDAKSHMVVGAYVSNNATDANELEKNTQEIKEVSGRLPDTLLADKGYAHKKQIEKISEAGIVPFIPLRNPESGRFSVLDFRYDEENDEYRCPAGRILEFYSESRTFNEDVYVSQSCAGCEISKHCLKNPNANRTLRVANESLSITELRQRMHSETWNQNMNIRAQTIELFFAWTKTHRKLRKFSFRGLNNVSLFWKFEAAVSNISRLMRLRLIKQKVAA